MRCRGWLGALLAAALGVAGTAGATGTPVHGGTLNFVVASKVPSYDLHRESTFGVIHPLRPFFSTLVRINPDNPAALGDFQCDLCEGEVPAPTHGGKRYTFRIKRGVRFHDGTPLTAADVKASLDKIMFPPAGVTSARRAFFRMVERVEAPAPFELVVHLRFPSAAFMPALATPFNVIYSKRDLDAHGADWFRANINGTGAFRFVRHQPGEFVEGTRFEHFHRAGLPYLDGFRALLEPNATARVTAIREDRAAIDFRGMPPKVRDELLAGLGDEITVQESDWNCVLLFTPNQQRKPFDDPRVRRALTLALDRWGASKYLSRIAAVRTVGGIVYPGHPLATPANQLGAVAGYGKDINAARREARALLAEAGAAELRFVLNNRAVGPAYQVIGTWLVDQWRRIGVRATQRFLDTPAFYAALRTTREFDVSIDFNCQSVVNPLVDITKFLGSAGNNHGGYRDAVLEDLYERALREPDPLGQAGLISAFERRALDDMAHMGVTLWWYRINPHRTYLKGWQTGPSHYVNQHLERVWLEPR